MLKRYLLCTKTTHKFSLVLLLSFTICQPQNYISTSQVPSKYSCQLRLQTAANYPIVSLITKNHE